MHKRSTQIRRKKYDVNWVIALVALTVLGSCTRLPPTAETCAQCPEVIPLEAGNYRMGSTPAQLNQPFLIPDRVTVEQPQQNVSIAYSFAMGVTEVTRGEFAAFVDATGHATAACLSFDFDALKWTFGSLSWRNPGFEQGHDHPVVCVSWEDAQAYVRWISARSGATYRLPSEAEWEYAARAGTLTLWPWGDDPKSACEFLNGSDISGRAAGVSSGKPDFFECNDGYAQTAPARFGLANPWGLHGMLGNAGEWTADCLLRTLHDAPTDGSPRHSANCRDRVIRGGSWFNPPMYNRPAFRYGTGQEEAYNLVGFRVVRESP